MSATVAPSGGGARLPLGFIAATFVVAAAIGGLILYFGIQGQLGAAIP